MVDFLYIAKGQTWPNFRSVSWLENTLAFTHANMHGKGCMQKTICKPLLYLHECHLLFHPLLWSCAGDWVKDRKGKKGEGGKEASSKSSLKLILFQNQSWPVWKNATHASCVYFA